MNKEIRIIEVPFALGSHRRGSDLGPRAIRYAGLTQKLLQMNHSIQSKELSFHNLSEEIELENLRHLSEIEKMANVLASEIETALVQDAFPLVIGGDHSIALGTITGLATKYQNLGVIWFDAHGDLNTHETTPSGNIHGMPLAASMGFGHDRLVSLGGINPKIKPENVVLFGVRDLDEGEVELIERLNITYYDMKAILKKDSLENNLPMILKSIKEKFIQNGVDGVHLSFDLDSLDPSVAPGVGTPVTNGISFLEANHFMKTLRSWNMITSVEFVETNPLFDKQNRTAEVAVELICTLLQQ